MTCLIDSAVGAAKSSYFVEVASMDAFNAAENKFTYISDISSKESGTFSTSRTGSLTAKGQYGDYAPGDAIQGFIIVFDEGQVNYAASQFFDGKAPAAVTPSFGVDFTAASTGWQSTTSSVPEPTSGLLLLLGVAGMALKRKRA